jgi:U32 family peptidase
MPMAEKKVKKKSAKKVTVPKPIGAVTHFYGNLSVAIVKFSKPVASGTTVRFKGATTDFLQTIKSMQFDHKTIETAKKGQEIGIKVDGKVREGDEVFAE